MVRGIKAFLAQHVPTHGVFQLSNISTLRAFDFVLHFIEFIGNRESSANVLAAEPGRPVQVEHALLSHIVGEIRYGSLQDKK